MSFNRVDFCNLTYGDKHVYVANPADVFDPERMEPYIREAEEVHNKIYTWDDIINIHVTHLDLKTIHRLPATLVSLFIQNTTLEYIIFPSNCTSIKQIDIVYSNLSEMPDVSHLTNLVHCAISYSNLQRIPFTSDHWPPLLKSLNLSANSFNSINLNIDVQLPTDCGILLAHNMLGNERNVERPAHQDIMFGSQNTYAHIPITTETIERAIAMEHLRRNYAGGGNAQTNTSDDHVKNLRRKRNNNNTNFINSTAPPLVPPNINDNRPILPPPPPLIIQPLTGTQTVHASSVCDSVTKSVIKIKELTNARYNANIQSALIADFITAAYKTLPPKAGLVRRILYYLFGNGSRIFGNDSRMIDEVTRYVNIRDTHTPTQTTYGELLARVWLLIQQHPQRADFIINVKYEIEQSVGYCFTGRFNRLVNSLIGFVDDIIVGISIKEQLQLEMGKLIASLGKGDITYEKCMADFTALFDDPIVKADASITKTYRESWLFALEDYKPDDPTPATQPLCE